MDDAVETRPECVRDLDAPNAPPITLWLLKLYVQFSSAMCLRRGLTDYDSRRRDWRG